MCPKELSKLFPINLKQRDGGGEGSRGGGIIGWSSKGWGMELWWSRVGGFSGCDLVVVEGGLLYNNNQLYI